MYIFHRHESTFQTLLQLSRFSIWKVNPRLKESSLEFWCNVTLNNYNFQKSKLWNLNKIARNRGPGGLEGRVSNSKTWICSGLAGCTKGRARHQGEPAGCTLRPMHTALRLRVRSWEFPGPLRSRAVEEPFSKCPPVVNAHMQTEIAAASCYWGLC